jgi:hypothetical protein
MNSETLRRVTESTLLRFGGLRLIGRHCSIVSVTAFDSVDKSE